jgi:ABC-type nitrate/sulfonate/bicarbonate transport system permease component
LEFATILRYSPFIDAGGAGTNGLLPHLLYSIRLTLFAGTVGIAMGILTGLLMGWSRRLHLLLEPPIEAVRTVPPLAAIPFFLAWFGPGAFTQFSIIVFYSSLRLVIYTIEAIRNIPSVHQEYAATLGANRWQVYRTVVLPGIVPELVGGMRVVVAMLWGIDVVAELMGAEFGVGRVLGVLAPMLAASTIVATILWIGLVAVTVDIFFMMLARRLTRWMPASSATAA